MRRDRFLAVARLGVGALDGVLVTVALIMGVLLVAAYASSSTIAATPTVIVLDEHPHGLPAHPAGAAQDR